MQLVNQLVLQWKPCICDLFWCVKCKVLNFYLKTHSINHFLGLVWPWNFDVCFACWLDHAKLNTEVNTNGDHDVWLFQGPGGQNKGQQEEKKQRMEEMKHGILSQVLDQSARSRCKNMRKNCWTDWCSSFYCYYQSDIINFTLCKFCHSRKEFLLFKTSISQVQRLNLVSYIFKS